MRSSKTAARRWQRAFGRIIGRLGARRACIGVRVTGVGQPSTQAGGLPGLFLLGVEHAGGRPVNVVDDFDVLDTAFQCHAPEGTERRCCRCLLGWKPRAS
jgi:hypothetical protein